ncbi:MAG TPA: response regulator transcription factor [Bradyrhizobium sp.]
MRAISHLNSGIEATDDFAKPSNNRQEQRALHSRPALGTRQADDRSSAGEAPARSKLPRSRDSREATGNRTNAKVDFPRIQDFPEGDEEGSQPKESTSSVFVIIHSRTVFRDCLAQCLQMAYVDHDVLSFSNIAEWLAYREPRALDAAVVIVVFDAASGPSAADLDILQTAVTDPVVIVSDTDDLNHIIRVLKSGVRGYIPTSLSFNVAVEALRLVKAGGVFIPASSIVADGDEPAQSKYSTLLTHRQMEVVEEIRHGKANKQIAYELNMSEHTVKVHLRHIMRKLKARNRTEVAVLFGNLLASHKDTPRTEHHVHSGNDTSEDPAS